MSTIRMTHQMQPTPGSRLHSMVVHRPLVTYFILAFAFAWLAVMPMTLSRNVGVGVLPYDLPDALALVLYLVASFIGPTIAATMVTAIVEGRAGVRQLLQRCTQWRVRPRWYAAVLGTNLLIWLLAYSALIGPELLAAAVVHWRLLVVVFLPYVAFGLRK